MATSTKDLCDLVQFIGRSLVDQEDQVRVTERRGETTVVIELRVAQSDVGKVIGKQGRTAGAIRTILGGASSKVRERVVLEIVEN